MEVGAIQVPVNPRAPTPSSPASSRRSQPSSSSTMRRCAALFDRAPDGRRARAGRRVRRRGDDPDLGHHRAVEARDADAPRLRDGGRGVPVLDAAHDRRPADDVAAAVPHQRARVLHARIGCRARRASRCSRRFSASGFLDAARRFGATEFNAIGAMLEILMRQPSAPDDADNPLRLCYTGPSPERERHEEIEARFGHRDRLRVRAVGVAVRVDLAARHASVRHARVGAPASGARSRERRARVVDDGGDEVGAGGTGELELRNPVIMRGYYEMPDETAAVMHDGWLRTGDLVLANDDDTYTFLGAQEGGDPPPGREPVARRGRGRARAPSRRRRSGGDRRAVGALGRRREGVRRRRARARRRRRRGARVRRRAARRVQGAALHRDRRRAAAHADRAPGEAPAPRADRTAPRWTSSATA